MMHRTAMNPGRSNIYRLGISYILPQPKLYGGHSHSTTDILHKKPTDIYIPGQVTLPLRTAVF
jgi:hypothetical protein